MTQETWSPVQDYPGYEVSPLGRVRSLNYRRSGEARLLAPYDCGGYLKVCLYRDGQRHRRFVHILVASTFVSNPQRLPEVNHKDGVRTNCSYNNLEWTTFSGNKVHALDVLHSDMGAQPRSLVLKHRRTGEQFRFPSVSEAARTLQISRTNLLGVLAGTRKSVNGFVVIESKEPQ